MHNRRYIGTNVRLVADVIDIVDYKKMNGLLLTLDFQKAFDTVEWGFLFKVLEYFNFGTSFTRWIKTIYKNPVACVKNNGHLSDNFAITRGVRQGCPLSAMLFILCAEILAIKIRSDNTLTGFQFNNNQNSIKISQYADDTILFLKDNTEMQHAFKLLEEFGRVSGLKLNHEKCEGYWLGEYKHRQINCSLYGIKWPMNIKYLGVFLGYNNEDNFQLNWKAKVNRISKILCDWEKRDLSLIGRIQILKTFALSQITLLASTLPIPAEIINELNRIMFKFLWQSNEKVKRVKMIRPIKHGGLNMVDLQSYCDALKAIWMSRISQADPETHTWAQIPSYVLQPLRSNSGSFIYNFDDNLDIAYGLYLPSFYKEVFLCYNKLYATSSETLKNNIGAEAIWLNKHIKNHGRKKNKLYLRNWVRSGINKICDLEFNNGILDEYYIYDKVQLKSNIYKEIFIVKNALLNYRHELANMGHHNNQTDSTTKTYTTSREMYKVLIEKKTANINIASDFLQRYIGEEDECEVFNKKVCNEKEIKLKEYNFKLLHGILPCNKNLKRWKIKQSEKCDVCSSTQSIQHLLFECNYVKPLWNKVNEIFNISVSFEMLLGVGTDKDYNVILTIMSFLIYKEWLLVSLEFKHRCSPLILTQYKAELKLRFDVYKGCKRYGEDELSQLETLINNL